MTMFRYLALSLLAVPFACTGTGPKAAPDDEATVWTSRAIPTGRVATSAVLVERGTPRMVPVGQPYRYEIRVTNLTGETLEDVAVTEYLGSDASLGGAEPEGTAELDGGVRWTLGALAPKETRTIRVTAVPGATGTLRNRCEVDYRALAYGDTTVVEPKISLDRTVAGEGLVGEPLEVRYTVHNPGTGTAREVVVTDDLPEGLATVDGSTVVRLGVGDLPPGSTREYAVKVKGSATGAYILRASASAAGGLRAETEPATMEVRRAVLAADIAGPAEWMVDRDAAYSIRVSNTGEGTAPAAVVTLELPPGFDFVSADEGGVQEVTALLWRLGDVPGGAERTLQVRLKAGAAGTQAATVTASARYTEPATAQVATRIVGVPALLLEVGDGTDPIGVGGEVAYTITVVNQGSAADEGVVVFCELEDTMEFVSAQGATEGAAKDGTVAFAPLPSLAPGEQAVWTIVVKAARAGDVRFKAKLTSKKLERPVEETESTRFFQ